jgi:hypothetical protein
MMSDGMVCDNCSTKDRLKRMSLGRFMELVTGSPTSTLTRPSEIIFDNNLPSDDHQKGLIQFHFHSCTKTIDCRSFPLPLPPISHYTGNYEYTPEYRRKAMAILKHLMLIEMGGDNIMNQR